MGNRSTLAPPPTHAGALRDYRTLTLPTIPRPAENEPSDDEWGAASEEARRRPAGTAAAGRRAMPRVESDSPAGYRSKRRMISPVEAGRPAAPGVPARRAAAAQALRRRAASASVNVRGRQVPIWLLANMAILAMVGMAVGVQQMRGANAASACTWHRVVPGDTLGNLGWQYHSNAMALARANHISNPNLIYVGQVLCIPQTPEAQAQSAPAVPANTSSQAPAVTGAEATNEQSFVQLALPYAVSAYQQCKWPVSLVLAQWGVEQGWHVPSYTGYNWGNVSAITGEPSVKGLPVAGSPTAFAYARTPADGLRYYVIYCHMGYYTGVAPAAASGGPNAAAVALGQSPWDAGHYTNINSPGSSLLTTMRVFNLYWYDDPSHQGQASQPQANTTQAYKTQTATKQQTPAPVSKPQPTVTTQSAKQSTSSEPIGLAPEPCDPHVPSWAWTAVNYKQAWVVPPGCYGGVYTVNPAHYVSRGGYGWCNWWVEVVRPDEPTLTWGSGLQRGSTPRVGATVYFAPFNQGASAVGHFAHVEAISPDGQYVLVSEMNDDWRGAGFKKVNYRYIRVEPGVTFIY
jgi:LysM domain